MPLGLGYNSLSAAFIATVLFRFDCEWVPPGTDGLVSGSADSRGIKDFQVSPGESLCFISACLNSLLVFLPGILVMSDCLDQQPDLALSTFSCGPRAVTFGCSLLLLRINTALVGSTGSTSKPGTAHCLQYCLAGREGMEWDSC